MRYLCFILIFLNTFIALFAQTPNTGRLDQLLEYANTGDTNGIRRLISQVKKQHLFWGSRCKRLPHLIRRL